MSEDEVQPISGSTDRALAGTNSSTHSFVFAVPEDMADFAGLKIRARMTGPS
jgi:hypothetical protein